jgi:CBS domain-containing protein
MLDRRIKSIPVVRGRQVVGIVARRDLLEVLARRDEDIARELDALLASELGVPGTFQVAVRDGIARLTGPTDTNSRRLATLLARDVPGVVAVQFDEE